MVANLHINPLKLRKVMVANEGSGTDVEIEESMSWEDAAKVSAVLMVAQIFIVFLPGRIYSDLMNNLTQHIFELFVFAGQTFFSNFIVLTGLSIVTKRKTN